MNTSPPTGKIQGLEKGVKVPTTMSPFRPDVSDRRDLVIAATGATEGGFDTVNMYDKGILSWGMMQWTLHPGSLQKALSFIKERLTAQGNSSLWSRLFGGLDLSNNDIVYQGELVTTKNNSRLREIFRGSTKPNEYDRTTAEHWARIFARAGRDAVIQALQTAYVRKEVDALLEVRLGAVARRPPTTLLEAARGRHVEVRVSETHRGAGGLRKTLPTGGRLRRHRSEDARPGLWYEDQQPDRRIYAPDAGRRRARGEALDARHRRMARGVAGGAQRRARTHPSCERVRDMGRRQSEACWASQPDYEDSGPAQETDEHRLTNSTDSSAPSNTRRGLAAE